uniref:Uncharacterized protein n=1 Tax=Dicentrarchus labrax TaxID=13489 RepID=A0A8P4GF95_DICLA
MFSEGLNRKKAHYQAILDSGTFADPSLSQTDDGKREVTNEMELHRRTAKVTHRWQRTGSFSHDLRPLSSSSKRKRRSLFKIKYCPYLSACHSAERRSRWVLRSAVHRAQRAMRFYYPDLVGKRIRHLYEEDDKSEVWYRGEVLCIHEANANPLKTIFEVRYDSEPEWKYYLELLIDYKKGWLKIEDYLKYLSRLPQECSQTGSFFVSSGKHSLSLESYRAHFFRDSVQRPVVYSFKLLSSFTLCYKWRFCFTHKLDCGKGEKLHDHA